jgi:bacillolysin
MTNKYSAAALLMLGTLAAATAQGQDASRIQTKVLGNDNQPELVQFNAAGKAAYRAADAQNVLREQLGLTADDQLLPARIEADQIGFTHQKFSQYYKGVRVEHADYSVHAKGDAIESISGDFERIAGLNTTPSLSAADALGRALDFVGARRYMWQDAAEEAGLKQQEGNPDATYRPQGELVIVRSSLSGQQVLAWKFNVYAKQPISRAYIYVDARSGQVVFQDAIIKHVGAVATFATAYSGSRSSATETATGGYRLRELTRGLGIETYNARKSNSYTAAVDFIDADNNWTAAEYNNVNFDNAALDAHWGAQSTYDYWKNVHGRNSYDNAGAKIKSYVHFDDVPGGAGFENAYWDGLRMTYGDGASRFRPLTALDVCGHEIGHAVCEKTANLAYQNESGAMNEGFSDIWGAAIEYYTAPTKSTWLIGEDIDKVRPGLRSMSNPNAEGQPDTYKGTYWAATTTSPTQYNDYGGVHTNSGVLNYWFYLVSVGGSGTNDIGSAFTVSGITIDKAAKIAYRAESVYLSANSTFANGRTYTIQAATDLYGAGSAEVTAVTNAWFAVGVGAASGGGGGGTVTYCTSNGTSTSYEWIDLVQLGSISRTSGKETGGYYNGTALSTTLTAGVANTISFSAGFTSTAYTEYFKVYIDYNKNGVFTDAGELVVSAAGSTAATTRTGSFTVPTTAKNGTTRMRVVMSDASATTSCGSFSYGETEDYTVNISGGTALTGPATLTGGSSTPFDNEVAKQLEVYPNPASSMLSLVLPGNGVAKSVEITDLRGLRVSGARFGENQVDVSGLAKGMYTITVSDGQKVFHQRFVKQ